MKHNILKGFILGMVFGIIIFCASASHSIGNEPHRPEIHCKHFIYGIPLGTPITNDLIIRDIYAMSSNDSTKFADWVAYRLDIETVEGKEKTKRSWKADPWLADEETLEPEDYKDAYQALNTDRGHQAPLASFKGTKYWDQTNYLSNITPQKSRLNRSLWRVLEEKTRNLVIARNTVYVLTGPLYEKDMPKLPRADEKHKIPSGYWKIIIYQENPKDPNKLHTAAFIFPQDIPKVANIYDYLVAIDDVEKRSGLNFLWELPGKLEERLERSKNVKMVKDDFYTETEPPVVKRKPMQKQKQPSSTDLNIEITDVKSPVDVGKIAFLQASTKPGANCTITVYYKSGPSKAKGLIPQQADKYGFVKWYWNVGHRTTPGKWKIKVKAKFEEKTATAWTDFTVE